MTEPRSGVVTWDRTEVLGVPTENGSFVLRIIDWCRIKRELDSIAQPIPWLQRVYSLFIGVFITTGLSSIGIFYAPDLPSWALPLYVCVSLASFVISIITIYLDLTIKKEQTTDVSRLKDDMKSIELTIPSLRHLAEE